MKTLLTISLILTCLFGFGQDMATTEGHERWTPAPDMVTDYRICCSEKMRNTPLTFTAKSEIKLAYESDLKLKSGETAANNSVIIFKKATPSTEDSKELFDPIPISNGFIVDGNGYSNGIKMLNGYELTLRIIELEKQIAELKELILILKQ